MSLIFAAIYRDGEIQATYTTFTGNFEQQGQAISKNCQGVKSSYQEGQYIYHTLKDQSFVYMCMTEVNYNRSDAHTFLEELKKLVYQKCPEEQSKKAIAYGLNNKLKNDIKQKYDLYNSPEASRLRKAQHNVSETKDVLLQNLDKILKRQEILDVLVQKSNYQKVASSNMKNQASKIRQQQKCKKIKLYLLISLLVLVAIYIIMVIICGGFGLQGCFGSDEKQPEPEKKLNLGFLSKTNTSPTEQTEYTTNSDSDSNQQPKRCLAKVIADSINNYFI